VFYGETQRRFASGNEEDRAVSDLKNARDRINDIERTIESLLSQFQLEFGVTITDVSVELMDVTSYEDKYNRTKPIVKCRAEII
jgi:hypothetical protein